jgi:hypothetical protein
VPAVLRVVDDAHAVPSRLPARRLFGIGAACVAITFAVLALLSLAGRADVPLDGAAPLELLVAWLVAASGMVALAWPWRDVLALVRAPGLRRAATVAAYFAGEVGKYVPGGIWPVVGRAERARRLGVAAGDAYSSVVLSLGLAYLAAGVVFAFALPVALLDGSSPLDPAWTLVVVPVGAALLHPRVLAPVLRLGEQIARRPIPFEPPAWRDSLRVGASYVPAWLCIGAATTGIGLVVAPDASAPQLFAAAVGSWIVGFLVVPAPGGVGVREVAFAAACGLPFGTGVAVAVAARLGFVAFDLVAFAVSTRVLARASVLDDVAGEAGPVVAPSVDVDAGAAERVRRRPTHRHRVVGVVVREESLPAEREQVLERGEPAVERGEALLEADAVHRVGVRHPAHVDADRARDGQALRR